MKAKKNNSLINQHTLKTFFIVFILLALVFVLNANKIAKADEGGNDLGANSIDPLLNGHDLGANLPGISSSPETCTHKECVGSQCKSVPYDCTDGKEENECNSNSQCKDDDNKEKCYCDACVGGCDPGCRQKAFYEDDCPCTNDCSECGGLSPEDETKCGFENPNPAEKQSCTTKCKSSCQDMWHAGNSCIYRNWWEFWTLWKKHDGNYCCPDSCDNLEGYTCEEGEVCPEDWLSPLTGEKKCCSAQCVKPCGYSEDNESSATGLIYIEELGLDEEELINDANAGMETNAVQEVIKAGGVAVCADECTDLKYTVEGSCDSSDEWCKNCVSSSGPHCCAYCPPKTVYEEGKGCVKPSCDSCEKITGLTYNKGDDNKNYLETGFSICKKECEDIDLGNKVIWEAYSPSEGNKWCSQINGGTDFEDATKCCVYCPPRYHYNPIDKECVPAEEVTEEFTWELECPYIVLSWEKYENAISYRIIPFYDKDKDKIEDGICEEDIINKKKSPFYYNLKLSSCLDYYTGNVKLQLIPQYPDEMSMKSYNTDWIDATKCNLESELEN